MNFKIFGFIVVILMIGGCQQPTVYFKNPIFYEPMYGNRTYYDKIIAPVSMVYFHDDEVLSAKCKVLSDIGYQIVMECLYQPYRTTPETIYYYRFTNAGKRESFRGACAIREEVFYEDESDLKEPSIIGWNTIRVKAEDSCGQTAPQYILDSYDI